HPERPEALARFGEAALQSGRMVEAAEALEEAVASFRASGDLAAAVRAMASLGNVLSSLGDPRMWTLGADAVALLEPLVPSPEFEEALELAPGIAERLEAREDVWSLLVVRAAQARILALQGQASHVAESLDWIESIARKSGGDTVLLGLVSSALAHVGIGHDD